MTHRAYIGLFWSGLASVVLVAAAGGLTFTNLRWVGGPLLLPGLLAGALFFPTGIHSDHPYSYLGFSIVLNVLCWWVLLFVLWTIEQRRKASGPSR
jgi:hypothetical protein